MNHNTGYIILAVIYIYMAIYTLSKDTRSSRNRIYFIIALLFAFWALVNSSMFLITDPVIAARTRRNMVISWGLIYSFIFHLVMILSGYYEKIKIRRQQWLFHPMVYLPGLVNIYLYYFNPYPPEALALTENGWIIKDFFIEGLLWNYYFYIYYVVFMVSAIIILIRWRIGAKRKAESMQANLLVVTFSIAMVLGSLLEIILPIMGYPIFYGITIYVALIPIAGIWYGMERYSLLSFDPTKLTTEMMSLMTDGMLILDDHGQIVLMNEGASHILGYRPEESLHIDALCEESILDNLESETMTLRRVDKEEVDVLVSTLPILDKVDEAYGMVMFFQDIRKLKAYQNELESLNNTLENKVNLRTNSLIQTNQELKNEVNLRRQAEEKNLRLANYDFLTGLPNQRLFSKKLSERIISGSSEDGFAVLFVDIDDFKNINDTLGHSAGDQLIIEIGKRFRDYVKEEVNLTRVGGDEFLILLEPSNDYEDQVNEIVGLFKEAFIINRYQLSMTCSIGGALYPKDGINYEALIKAADIAMYKAKEKGSIRYRFYDDAMIQGLEEEVSLTNELYRAIEDHQLCVHYQPIVNAETGDIISAEALVRWQHPQRGVISPGVFIPLAEKIGIMDAITEVVLRDTGLMLETLNLPNNFKIAVNISANQLNNDGMFHDFEDVVDLEKSFEGIDIEVTENAFIRNPDEAIRILEKIRDQGIGIAIDDFGVNYSSLNYIKRLPINKLKIDKVFVDGIGYNRKDEGIIVTIITLAKKLGLAIVAEGVEREEQKLFLQANGCHIIQGYYFHKPMPSEDFVALLENSKQDTGTIMV